MRCVPVAILPQLSVAVHVRIITCPDAQSLLAVSVVSVKVISTSVSQLSVAVMLGMAVVSAVPQATSTSVGMPANTGGVLSCTIRF